MAKSIRKNTCILSEFYVILTYKTHKNHTIEVKMANLTITLDDEDKKGIADFCEKVGMTISGLYNVFTKQVLREGKIPFEIGIDRPNRETIKAMKEGDKLVEKYKKNPSSIKTYNTVNDIMRAMLK